MSRVRHSSFGAEHGEHIRPAIRADLPSLTAVAHEAKRHWRYPEQWIEAWEALLTITPGDLATQQIFVAESDGSVVGFCSVGRENDTWCVEHLWVRPQHMGRDVGRTLLRTAVRYVSQQGGSTLTIESDPHAEGFYLRLGARRIGEIPAHMGPVKRFLPLLELPIH